MINLNKPGALQGLGDLWPPLFLPKRKDLKMSLTMDDLMKELNQMKSQVGELKDEVDTLEDEVEELKDEVQAVKKKIFKQ